MIINSEVKEYYEKRSQLNILHDILLYQNRIVIPNKMKKEILTRIHDDGHLSLHKCMKRSQNSVWWPFISKELRNYIEKCNFCQTYRRRNRSEATKTN